MILETPISITMLGASKAGKTCFMLGMYSVMREGVHGFTFSTPDTDLDLELDERYQIMVEREGEERWPEPTDQPRDYKFHFNYCMRTVVEFDWLDYRGDALQDVSSAQDVQTLKKALKRSSAIFLCVSAIHLQKPIESRMQQVRRDTRIARMLVLLQESLQNSSPDSSPAIAIVLTMYDCVKLTGRARADVMTEVRRLFEPLFHERGGFDVAICPVSLGDDLAKGDGNALIEPVGLHQPVSYATCLSLQKMKDRIVGQQSSRQTTLGELERGIFSSIFQRGAIDIVRREIDAEQAELSRIDQVLPLLYRDLLQHCVLYHSGKDITG